MLVPRRARQMLDALASVAWEKASPDMSVDFLMVLLANVVNDPLKWGEIERRVSMAELEPAADYARPVILRELRDLQPGWDGKDAERPAPRALALAEAILSTPGRAFPNTDGGVQIEWRTRAGSAEIVISSEGQQEFL